MNLLDMYSTADLVLVFRYGNLNSGLVGCSSEAELIELANRRRSIGDSRYDHIGYGLPFYRRLRALQRLKVR